MSFNFHVLHTEGVVLYLNETDRLVRFDGLDTAQVVYDTSALGFAVSNDDSTIAVMIPLPFESKPNGKRRDNPVPKMEVRVFGLVDGWLSSLLGTFVTSKYKFGGWSDSGKFLFLYDGDSRVSIVALSTRDEKLEAKVLVDDRGRHPLCLRNQESLGLFSDRDQQLAFWNLASNSQVATLPLSRRSTKVLHIVCADSLLVALYDDMSLTFTHYDGLQFTKLQKFDDLFQPKVEENEKKDRAAVKRIIVAAQRLEESPDTLDIFVGSACSPKVFHFTMSENKIVKLVGEGSLHASGLTLRGCLLSGKTVIAASTSGRGKHCGFETLLFEQRLEEGKTSKSRSRRKKKQTESTSHETSDIQAAACDAPVTEVEPTNQHQKQENEVKKSLIQHKVLIVAGITLAVAILLLKRR